MKSQPLKVIIGGGWGLWEVICPEGGTLRNRVSALAKKIPEKSLPFSHTPAPGSGLLPQKDTIRKL